MSAIRSRGRRGSTSVPNWRWEDESLDPFELRVAGWLASHTDSYSADHVTRNEIARRTGISAGKVTNVLRRLAELGLIEVETVQASQRDGGQRLRITFDFDAWETEDPGHEVTASGHVVTGARSCGDHPPGHVVTTPGHVVTATRGHQLEEQVEKNNGEVALAPLAADDFDGFWQEYPNKKDRGEARIAWRKLSKRDRIDAIEGARRHAAACVEFPRRFVLPNGATWLNKRRWEEETPREPPAPPQSKRERALASALQNARARAAYPNEIGDGS